MNIVLKGGGTRDELVPGPGEGDTISYADATTPGFSDASGHNNQQGVVGFPGDADGRGVYVDLSSTDEAAVRGGIPIYAGTQRDLIGFRKCEKPRDPESCSNVSDRTEVERIVGSPYADYIKDSPSNDTYIDGGPGPDFLEGNGGTDTIYGGSELDYITANSGSTVDGNGGGANCSGILGTGCFGTASTVEGKDPSLVRVGAVQTSPAGLRFTDYYLTGSNQSDNFKVYFQSDPARVVFAAQDEGTRLRLTTASVVGGDGCWHHPKGSPAGSKQRIVCAPDNGIGSVLVDGRESRDTLKVSGFPRQVHVYVLGGLGNDNLHGGRWGDSLVDGDYETPNTNKETLFGGAGDDLVVTGGGFDHAFGGPGNDLMMNGTFCSPGNRRVQGGGLGSDNLQFAQIQRTTPQPGFVADLAAGTLGQRGSANDCTDINGFEDIEGSFWNDTLLGDENSNLLMGRGGSDIMRGREGNDRLYAFDGIADEEVDCGATGSGPTQNKRAVVDLTEDWGAPNSQPGVVSNCGPKRPKFNAEFKYLSAPVGEAEAGTEEIFPDANEEAFFRLNEESGPRIYNWATDIGDLTEDGVYASTGTGTNGVTFETPASVMPDTAIALASISR